MAYETITLEKEDGIATVTLNRPQRLNAWTPVMGAEMTDAFRDLDRDPAVRVAVVAPGEHPHEPAVEIRAELTSPQDIGSVTPRLPEEFQPVLVVSYRPSQVWVEPKTPSTVIRF